MKKYLRYPLMAIFTIFSVFIIFTAVSMYGSFVYLSDLEKDNLDNYNANYEQSYSKTQTPEDLFQVFTERITQKDKKGVRVISVPAFSTLPQETKDKDFDGFYDKFSKYDFSKASFTVKYDTAKYFEIKNVLQNEETTTQKIYFNMQQMEHLSHKLNRFPIKNYYVLESKIWQKAD